LVEDETSEDSECSECHQSENGKNPIVLITAYHANCKGCHVEKETGPIMCGECHTK
jgi:predicted CXXCH cytochrome family protein